MLPSLAQLVTPLTEVMQQDSPTLHLAVRQVLAAFMLGASSEKAKNDARHARQMIDREMEQARKLYAKVKRKRKEVNTEGLPAPLGSLTEMFTEEIRQITALLQAGKITLAMWESEFEAALVRYQLAAAMAGVGSAELPEAMVTQVSGFIVEQLGYLLNFETEIAESEEEWQAGWNARAESYAGSIKQPYWTGEVNMLPLPAMPGDGTSQCLGNCRCSWEITVVDEEEGDYDCKWIYGDTDDHCQTCRAREQEWNPLRIRGGRVE